MSLHFANYQYLMSDKVRHYPRLGKLLSNVFGTTNIGQYARADIFKKIIKKLPLHKFEKVLDLGCGQGEYSFMLAGAIPDLNIVALDLEPQRIKKIQTIAKIKGMSNLRTHSGKAETLKEENSFDLIYSVDVFEHIEEEQMPFREAFDLLKSGGYLIVKMPSKIQNTVLPERFFVDHKKWLKDEHIGQLYMLEDLKKRMLKEGFEVIYSNDSDGLISRLSWELSYLLKKQHALLNLIFLPLLKLMVKLDRIINIGSHGNAIQVIGQKTQ